MYEPKTFAEFLTMPAIEKFPYAEFKKQQQAVSDEPIVRRGRGKK